MKHIRLIGVIFTLIFTMNCEKQYLPSPPIKEEFPNCRLIEIQKKGSRSGKITKTVFEYDKELLTKETVIFDNEYIISIYLYEYEHNGNIINKFRYDSAISEKWLITKYELKNDILQSIKEYDSENEIWLESKYQYENGHLRILTKTNSQYGVDKWEIKTDSKGKVIYRKQIYYNGQLQSIEYAIYSTYDDKLNPFYHFPGGYGFDPSQNNVISSISTADGDTTSTSKWSRTYYDNRLLKTRIDKSTYQTFHNTFIYDCE